MKLVWSRLADGDLVRIWQSIASDSEKAADDVLDQLQARAEELISFPKMGPLRSGRHKDVRQLVEGNYLIFYRIADQTIEILHVFHGKQDLADW